MNLFDFANIFNDKYKDTAAMNTTVYILTYQNNNPLWEGTIAQLYIEIKQKRISGGWIIVEMVVDRSRQEENHLPDYNKSKILKVI